MSVIRLPHIANFTDFELLEQYCSGILCYHPEGILPGTTCIIIPGTKNTIEDLEEVISSFDRHRHYPCTESGIPVIGICGGYQCSGEKFMIRVLNREKAYPGLGLLDVITSFSGYEKHTVQVVHLASAHPPILSGIGTVKGYEIHMGTTERGRDRPAFGSDGAVSDDGLVIGTYMHGLLMIPLPLMLSFPSCITKKGNILHRWR